MSSTHSPQFIAEMKEKLLVEKKQIEAELSQISNTTESNTEAAYPDYDRDEEANAMEVADFVATTATTEAVEKRLKELDLALESITKSTYGMTQDGEMIPENRLRANPAATTLVKHN